MSNGGIKKCIAREVSEILSNNYSEERTFAIYVKSVRISVVENCFLKFEILPEKFWHFFFKLLFLFSCKEKNY